MAKIVKKKKKFKASGLASMLFVFSFLLFLFGRIYLHANNVTLAREATKLDLAIDEIQERVNVLAIEVEELLDRTRILNIAKENGIDITQDSVIIDKEN